MTNRHLSLLFIIAAVIFTFQNCGRSGFDTSGDATLLSVNGLNPNSKNTSPVAFDVGLDTIAYNSCVPSVRTAPGYFTVKATAGGIRGGVRLSPDFLTSANSQLRPILGNPTVLDVQYKELIEATNPDTELQAAFRATTDLQATYLGTAPDGILGRMDYLSHDSWLTPLVDSARNRENQFVSYSARAPSNKSRFDFKFSQDFGSGNDYWSGLLSIQGFRACVSQGCQGFGRFNLAVGFSERSNPRLIRGPAANNSAQVSAYGRGYQLQFGHPRDPTSNNVSQVFVDHGPRAVKGIIEYDLRTQNQILENGSPTGWSCTEIPIMSPNQRGYTGFFQTSGVDDNGQALCNPMQGDFVRNNFAALNIDKIRQILPPESWQLGYQNIAGGSRLCAIPIGFDCYPTESYQRFVNGVPTPHPYYVSYRPGQACINEENLAVELTKIGAEALNRVCGQYVSVCTKRP